jgi:hypothetical protein
MIIKFKIFENLKYSNSFWLVKKNSPYFEISLDKLNVPEKLKNKYLSNRFIKTAAVNKIYISPFEDTHKQSWSERSNVYESRNFVYEGEIKITREDIEDWKIKKESEKYNL